MRNGSRRVPSRSVSTRARTRAVRFSRIHAACRVCPVSSPPKIGTSECLTGPVISLTREASGRAMRVEGGTMRQGHLERRLRHELDTVFGRLDHAGALAASDELCGELVDDAQVIEVREDHQLTRARLVQRAKGLLDALQRLRVGTYGRCDECEASIPIARLRALPSATTCVRCQVRREGARVRARR